MKASVLVEVATAIEDAEWEQLKTEHQKQYAHEEGELARYWLFKQSEARVAKLNALNPEPVFGITWMSVRHSSEQFEKALRKPVVLWYGREYGGKKEKKAKKKDELVSMSTST